MNEQKKHHKQFEEELTKDIGSFAYDPLGFVLYAFPWGHGQLANKTLENWQREELEALGESLKASVASGDTTATEKALRLAITSGHGIGKSAFVAWIILWACSTLADTRIVVTANTEAQLKGKTWAELAKWHRLCLCGHWFDCTATALISKAKGHEKTWRCDVVAWSEKNTEAFAGLHNRGRRIVLIMDEASAIPDVIWEVSEGALTDADTEILFLAFGNPTRNTGRFRECFGRFKHRWKNRQVDSRTVSITNKAQIQEWVDDYGEDSDFVRIRVRGVFPRSGTCQLIPADLVDAAMARTIKPDVYAHAAKIMGVDVARFGDDQSVISLRQGLALLKPQQKYRGLDTMTFAGIVAQEIEKEQPDAVFVDVGGIGAGVVDRLHQLAFRNVIGIDFGAKASNPTQYANKRTEMWSLLGDWFKKSPMLPYDSELLSDVTAPEYSFTGDSTQIALEKKKDMKKRGLSSPDCGDSLALTFAAPVRPKHMRARTKNRRAKQTSSIY